MTAAYLGWIADSRKIFRENFKDALIENEIGRDVGVEAVARHLARIGHGGGEGRKGEQRQQSRMGRRSPERPGYSLHEVDVK